jgi:hypothetical protein
MIQGISKEDADKLQKAIDDATYNEGQIRNTGLRPECNHVQFIPEKSNQLPTVGRIVHYFPHANEFTGNDSSPVPAVIVRVWSDVCVNLKVFTDGPLDIWKTSICKKPDGLLDNVTGFWDWPQK